MKLRVNSWEYYTRRDHENTWRFITCFLCGNHRYWPDGKIDNPYQSTRWPKLHYHFTCMYACNEILKEEFGDDHFFRGKMI